MSAQSYPRIDLTPEQAAARRADQRRRVDAFLALLTAEQAPKASAA